MGPGRDRRGRPRRLGVAGGHLGLGAEPAAVARGVRCRGDRRAVPAHRRRGAVRRLVGRRHHHRHGAAVRRAARPALRPHRTDRRPAARRPVHRSRRRGRPGRRGHCRGGRRAARGRGARGRGVWLRRGPHDPEAAPGRPRPARRDGRRPLRRRRPAGPRCRPRSPRGDAFRRRAGGAGRARSGVHGRGTRRLRDAGRRGRGWTGARHHLRQSGRRRRPGSGLLGRTARTRRHRRAGTHPCGLMAGDHLHCDPRTPGSTRQSGPVSSMPATSPWPVLPRPNPRVRGRAASPGRRRRPTPGRHPARRRALRRGPVGLRSGRPETARVGSACARPGSG